MNSTIEKEVLVLTRFEVVLLVFLLLVGQSLACQLTTNQRVSTLNRAVQLLTKKEGQAGRATSTSEGSNLEVVGHQYFNHYKNRYALVRRVKVEDSALALNEDEANTGRLEEFAVRAGNVKVGIYVNVTVLWDDGETYRWEHQVKPGQTRIEVWKPN
jgi:hypothetical protein